MHTDILNWCFFVKVLPTFPYWFPLTPSGAPLGTPIEMVVDFNALVFPVRTLNCVAAWPIWPAGKFVVVFGFEKVKFCVTEPGPLASLPALIVTTPVWKFTLLISKLTSLNCSWYAPYIAKTVPLTIPP
jgi:hypothetical protein